MANEAVKLALLGDGGDPVRYTVANGTAISAGTLLHFRDPNTVIASQRDGDYFAGIAAADKEASDGATTIAAYTKGKFDLTCTSTNKAISAGQLVKISGANLIDLWQPPGPNQAGDNAGTIVGKALEDTGASSSEVIAVAVGVFN